MKIVAAASAACAAAAVIGYAAGHALLVEATTVTVLILSLVCSATTIAQTRMMRLLFDDTMTFQRITLARAGRVTDSGDGTATLHCPTCQQPSLGYTGEVTTGTRGHQWLVETRTPCGCEIDRLRLLGAHIRPRH